MTCALSYLYIVQCSANGPLLQICRKYLTRRGNTWLFPYRNEYRSLTSCGVAHAVPLASSVPVQGSYLGSLFHASLLHVWQAVQHYTLLPCAFAMFMVPPAPARHLLAHPLLHRIDPGIRDMSSLRLACHENKAHLAASAPETMFLACYRKLSGAIPCAIAWATALVVPVGEKHVRFRLFVSIAVASVMQLHVLQPCFCNFFERSCRLSPLLPCQSRGCHGRRQCCPAM